MKKFVTHLFIFGSLILISIYLVLSQADGTADPYYLRFTTPKQSNLILGTSKAAQGILPSAFKQELDLPIYNYSFAVGDSPFGLHYYNSIEKKLAKTTKDGIFILTIDCWGISCRDCKDPNDLSNFRENKSAIAKIKTVDVNPNIPYLLDNMMGKYYRILHKPKIAILRDDGWLDVSIDTNAVAVSRRTKLTLLDYEKSIPLYQFSDLRFDYLKMTIRLLNQYGKVYLVRLPVSPEFMKIEKQVMPDIDKKISRIIGMTSGYLDFTPDNSLYQYTDGVHLQKKYGKQVSLKIAKWIKSQNKVGSRR